MSKLTNIELVQANTVLTNHIADLEERLSLALIDLEREKLANKNMAGVASAMNSIKPRPQYVRPQWQVIRAEEMRIAKELAMISGRSVLI